MGIFDGIFNTKPQQDAAQDQIAGINAGLSGLTTNINQGNNALQTNYAAGLAPFQQNYASAGAGQTMLGNALGVNGAQGSADALTAFQNSNPGYGFQMQQGQNAVLANQAKTGQLASGNTNLDLLQFGQGLANSTYGNWVSQLQPYLGAANSAAGGIGTLNAGLGTALNQNSNTLGNATYGANTSIGNANANATNAQTGVSGNILGAIGGGLNLISGLGGFGGLGGMVSSGNASVSSNPFSSMNVNNGYVPNVNGGGIVAGGGPAASLFGFADGGRPEPGKPAIVGERGPEIFVPDQPGTVVPNEALTHGSGLTGWANGSPTYDTGDPWAVAAERTRRSVVSPRQPGQPTPGASSVFHDMAKELMRRAMEPPANAAAPGGRQSFDASQLMRLAA